MIKFVCYITLSITICLFSNLMAQDTDSKQSSSHQITAADSQKSAAAKSQNNGDKSKPEREKPQGSKKDEIEWTNVAATIIAIFGLMFVIYRYIRRQQDRKKGKAAELEAEDEHRIRKERQVIQTSEDLYRHTLEEELGTIRMLGSPDIKILPVRLLETFVSPDISETWRSESRQLLQMKKPGKQTADRSFPPDEVIERAFEDYRMLLIFGEPGSGKTTLLKYYAMCCLIEKQYQEFWQKQVFPFYFPLRELKPDNAYPDSLPENLARWATRHPHNIPVGTFYEWLHNRDTLILLDGLDEIRDLDQRKRVCEWIDNTAQGLKRARFVMTSRWTGYRKSDGIELGVGHLRVDVKPFSPKQQTEFLKKWYNAVYFREYRDEDLSEDEREKLQKYHALKRAQAIIEFINDKKNKRLRELAAVPMLLQIMAIIWKERDHLPQSRSELYNAALKYLLDYRDRHRKLDPDLPADKALRVMAPVSLWMQEELNAEEVAKPALYQQMQPIIKTMDDCLTSEQFCINLRDRAGLLADYGKDAYIFRHKSFREYMTGLQLIKDIHKPDRLQTLVRYFGSDWWEEPLIFFISEVDDDMFDKFMDTFFGANISKELDQKSQNLLQQLVEEAPQKKIDSLARRLNDGRIQANKKRYILNCLKTIGNAEALATVEMFYEANKNTGLAANYAGEIIAEMSAGKSPKAERQKTEKTLFKIYPPSFLNPHELNAEYLCIPEGSYRYSVSGNMETVSYLYFAKYAVTNKRYRSFISYLAGKKTEMTDSLPLTEFQEQLLRVASNIKDFSRYIGNDPEKWSLKFRSEYEEEKRFKGDDQPVVGVSWYDVRSYCLWLSLMAARESKTDFTKATGLFRLPTESEWEWAAAGRESDGSLREYPWPVNKGEPNDKLANYDENVGVTTPVGRYPDGATPEGLMDMAGNVWEWMENRHEEESDWRALRGGSWPYPDNSLRCSARFYNYPVNRNNFIGFRVVLAQS